MPPTTSLPAPILIANWKMNLGVAASVRAAAALRKLLPRRSRATVVLCPSFPALVGVQQALGPSGIRLGAQNVSWDTHGAYTGEVSALVLKELGVSHVIVGHSERRRLLGETDVMVGRKMTAVLASGLTPVLCVGESADERRRNHQDLVIRRQLHAALAHCPPPRRGQHVLVAYEPIWAINTGRSRPADPVLTMRMRDHIYRVLIDLFEPRLVDQSFRILYGGSVDARNAADYVSPNLYDGALVGTASIEARSFATMIRAVDQRFAA